MSIPDSRSSLPCAWNHHVQICDNSASCWSIGEQQLAIKGSVSLRNFRQPLVRSVWNLWISLMFPPLRRRWRGPMRQELCLSSRRSSFLPSSLQRWAEAASFLHGGSCRYSTFQQLPLCSSPTGPSLLWQSLRYADEARDGPDAAIRAARLSLLLEAAQQLLKRSSLPSSDSSRLLCLPLCQLCLPLCRLCQEGSSPPRLP